MSLNRMLVAYDGSKSSEKALLVARRICNANQNIELLLVHVVHVDLSRSGAAVSEELIIEESREVRDELASFAKEVPNKTKVMILRGTSPADLIVTCAQNEQCDLIVMGSRGKGGVMGYLGSVSRKVIADSSMDVYIAKVAAPNSE